MGQKTLAPFSENDEARLVDQILNGRGNDRNRVARAMLESGAAFKQEYIQNAQEFRMDREFIAVDFTDVVVSTSAYVSGSAAKRAVCIAADHKDAITKEHAGDLIVITHLVLPYDTSNANIVAGLRISANDLAFSLEVPSIQRPKILEREPLAAWLSPDVRIEGQDFDAGQQVVVPERRGEWENGMRKLPRPLVIAQGKRAELTFELPDSAQTPGSNNALPLKIAFRYHQLVGVSGK